MDKSRLIKLDETYEALVNTALFNHPLEKIRPHFDDQFMGYGTAEDENLSGWEGFKFMVLRQRKELGENQVTIKRIPMINQYHSNGKSAVKVEEFEMNTDTEEIQHRFKLRLSTVLEFVDGKWMVRHFHGSTADADTPEGSAWPIEEWKRRNAELQKAVKLKTRELLLKAKELEIEAALERVRTTAMSMQKPEDLSTICEKIFVEMKGLGFLDLRNTEIIINQDEQENIRSYYFSDYGVSGVVDVDCKSHPLILQWFHDLQKQADAFAEVTISKDQMKEWEEYRRSLNYIPDPKLSDVDQVFYYSYATGSGALSISSFTSLGQDDIVVLKRFRNVFTLAYQRYIDIQLAEQQARGAQIEASLERVRARSMAMHSSEELGEVAKVMFDQMQMLGGDLFAFGVVLCDKHENIVEQWHSLGEAGMMTPFYVPIDLDHIHRYRFDQWKKGVELFSIEIPSDYIEHHFELMFELPSVRVVKQDLASKGIDINPPPWEIDYGASFNNGYLLVSSLKPFKEDNIFPRFAKVFEQAYTRFLDLEKAEQQAREAQIVASLERVRAASMAMHHSDELSDVLSILFEQFDVLQINPSHAVLTLIDQERNILKFRMTGRYGYRVMAEQEVDLKVVDAWVDTTEKWKKSKPNTVNVNEYPPELLPEIWEVYHDIITSIPDHARIKIEDFPDGLFITEGYCRFGYIGFAHNRKPTEKEKVIVVRFAAEFGTLYQRFLELQKAEQQAREAKIEATLERVRSRSMGMQKSEELKDVIQVIFNQLSLLDINAEHAGIVVDYKPKQDWTFWVAETQDIPSRINVPYLDSLWDRQYTEAKEKEMDFFTTQFNFEEKNRFYKNLLKHIPELTEEARDFYFSCAGLAISTAIEKDVGLYIENFSGTPYSEEENMVLKRCVKVFQQAYIRFLDLKRAEEQTRQAKIETALERVRARAMAMQEPEELKEVAQVLRTEMGKLDIAELETCSIYIKDPESLKAECWYAIKDIRGDETVLVKDQFKLDLEQTWVGREMLSFYDSQDERVSIVMKGDNRKEWMDYCEKHSKPLKGYYGDVIPERTYHLYKFSNGSIGFASAGDISEESWNILSRAASAFSLAFSRFQDLTKARLDLIKLKEEKKRAEDALSDLKEAQRQLIHAEKMASLGELTAGIAHEIQNPLNFVNNFSEVSGELIDEAKEEMAGGDTDEANAILDDLKENLTKISHHGHRASGIVRSMLDHSKASSGEKVATDINALCDEYLRLAYHGLRAKDKDFNAAFKTDFDDSLPKVNVVPQDIGRVLLNLINNAFYAVDEKKKSLTGLEALSEMDEYKPSVEISTSQRKGQVVISVKDNGNGIPKDVVDKIFQPFFTTKPTGQGTGLGLSLSYDIVKAHGGELLVRSKEGKGTEFEVSILFS